MTSETIQHEKRHSRLQMPARIQGALARIAESDCPVLILGEPGAGKRFMAEQIHAHSKQARSAFRELRGEEAGVEDVRAAAAAGGTVYLSDITEISLTVQALIVELCTRSDEPQGWRLLCGSSHELLEEVKAWRVREDFYYFVSAVTLRLPPLRCRKTEILSIADELLTQYSKQFDRPKPVLCKESVDHLLEHSWPGNLTELQTAIKTFVAIGDQAISLAAIKAATASGRSNGNHRHPLLKEATRASSIQIERQLITEVLSSTGGNRKRAAAELGIRYKALLYKLKQMETESPLVSHRIGVA